MVLRILVVVAIAGISLCPLDSVHAISCKVAAQKVAKACKQKKNKIACGIAQRQLRNCNGGSRR